MNRKSKAKISRQEIWKLYCQGYSFNAIGEVAGLTGEMIRKICRDHPGYARQAKAEQKRKSEQIKKLLQRGKNKKEIAKLLGISKTKLNTIFQKDEALIEYYQSGRMSKDNQDMELIWDLHQQGFTYKQIANQMGRSVTYVVRKIRMNPKYRDKEQRHFDKGMMIRFLKLSGLSLNDISQQIGIGRKAIKKYL